MGGSFLRGVVVGLVCALLGGAAVALAGSGVGGVFNLGVSNSVDAKTLLTGASPSAQLQVVNTNSAAGAYGLLVANASSSASGSFTDSSSGTGVSATSRSGIGVSAQSGGATKPALSANNTAGGPAASFSVSPGVAPFTVSNTVKIGNLNADLLDGMDSSTLQRRVSGSCAVGSAVRVVNADGSVACQATGSGGGSAVAYAHVDSDGTVDLTHSKNITQAMVTHPQAGVYCFDNLGFTPNSINATVGGQVGAGVGPTVPTVITDIPSFSICSSDAEVGMVDPSNGAFSRDASFWVVFN